MTSRTIIRWLLILWAILAFRLTLGPKIAIAGVQPDLAAAFVFYLTLVRGPVFGMLAGFTLGLLIDVDSPDGLGLTSLAWCTMAFLATRLAAAIDASDRVLSSVMLFVLVLAAETVRAVIVSGIDPARFGWVWIRWAVPTALYTGVAVPLFLLGAEWVFGETRWLRGGS